MALNSWKLEGSYFEACNCDAACPCVFMSPPTEGACNALVAWHIDKGYYNGINLDGLNIAMAINSPGHMLEVMWNIAVYVDETADEAQRRALFSIFSGEAGGHPASISSLVGAIIGVRSIPFEYRVEGRTRSLRLGDIGDVEIEAISGRGGAEVTVANGPFCVAPGYPVVVARSIELNLKDTGFNWHFTNKSAFYSPFSYSG